MTNPEKQFEIFRKAYLGRKYGLEVEFDEFTYSCRKNSKRRRLDWRIEIDKLLPALKAEIIEKRAKQGCGTFCPPWADLHTWLHQRRWTVRATCQFWQADR